jgi:hypothetical protein
MGSVAETFGERLVSDVITEAFDEMTGRSNRKWAAVLVAAIAGAIIAAAIARRRRRGSNIVTANDTDGTT